MIYYYGGLWSILYECAMVLKLLHFLSPNTADDATSCPSCFTFLPDTVRVPFLSVASAIAASPPSLRQSDPLLPRDLALFSESPAGGV